MKKINFFRKFEEPFYHLGKLWYGFSFLVKVSVKKAIKELAEEGELFSKKNDSIYEVQDFDDNSFVFVEEEKYEDKLLREVCPSCSSQTLRVWQKKCTRCGSIIKLEEPR